MSSIPPPNLKRKFASSDDESQDYDYKKARVADQNYRSSFERVSGAIPPQKNAGLSLQELFQKLLKKHESQNICITNEYEGCLENLAHDLRVDRITSVTFTSMKVSHFVIKKALHIFPNLEEIQIKQCLWTRCDRDLVLEKKNDVLDLTLDECAIFDEHLFQLIHLLPQVAHLEITQCKSVTSRALALAIKRLASVITYLDLSRSTIGGGDFKTVVESCSNLTYLYCNCCELTFDELMEVNFPKTLMEIEYEDTKMSEMEELEFGMKKLNLG